ncbi:hypothetical protein AURANDRAFT_65260 [Aureococcus anophagefferens]|uniref:Uncharacterized protein n=1 Tax=Aureococcus anophagefferens TaxID=44056 RepID=F0YD99_AURAN|nr:hypothetical protein AURANDRAFT_65260 [Aureococcus anophagefferens]EGB07024.1 hypothetical protein AURANDRAFT_65260 [Aureococcus anophagefferens]|eukprot:XP_009038261.1 hypothetical protein AURANDRAFT_65260 [Aureococcus anophagefferens]
MHSGVPLPAMSVLPQLPPAPVISDEALLHELDTLVQQQRQSQRFDEPRGGSREADVAAMPPPPQRAGSGELLNSGSGGSLSKYLAPGDGGGGIRKRLASHQSIHSVGSFDNGQMTEIGGHGPDRQRGKHGSGGDLAGAGGGGFRVARRTNSKSSLASDDWDLNIADVDSLNLDDWRWSESQNGPALSSFGGRQGGDFLRSSGGAGGMGGGRTHSGNSLGGLADLQQGLPLTDLPRSRSGEGLLAQPMLNANDPRVSRDSVVGDAPENTSVVAKNTPSFFVEKTPSFVAEKTPPFVEGEVHVLARCRFQGCDRGALAWRQAFYSVDLVDGALRVFRSDEDRRTWRRQGGENLAKWAAVIGGDHVVADVAAAPPPSAGKRNRRSRRAPTLEDVPESEEDDESPLASSLEDAASREGDLPLRNRPAPRSCADCARDVDYCSFEVWKRADVGGDGSGAPLLKFAAAPDDRDDLDVLHDALEAISLTSATHVIEP